MNHLISNFSERLKELREEKNLTRLALAKELGFNKNAVQQWERMECNPTLPAVIKLAQYFNVSLDYMAGAE